MKKRLCGLVLVAMLSISTLYGCSSKDNNKNNSNFNDIFNNDKTEQNNSTNSNDLDKFDIEVTYSEKEKLSLTKNDLTKYSNIIELNDESVMIEESGEYVLNGKIDNGQIIVDVPDNDDKVVTLILNGVEIVSKDSAAIYVKNAKKVVLSLVEGTINSLADGETYTYADEEKEEPNACIFSKDDLVISGNGCLKVTGNFNNGIYSKDDLTITGGEILVESVNNGIKGKDSVAVLDANISVKAGGDGICASNNEDEGKGFISIENGSFNIISSQDGIQAETCLEIKNGSFDITTGEGANVTSWGNEDKWGKPEFNFDNNFNPENFNPGEFNPEDFKNGFNGTNSKDSDNTVSIKAIKAGVDITISGGSFVINSEDDAIHTNSTITIDNGSFNIKSGDDGIHGDETVTINNGEILISQCYEGIEATDVKVNDGNIHITATDDGFNAAGGNDSSAVMGRPGMNMFGGGTGTLEYNGGYIYVNSSGDGLDSNGTITVNGGYIIVDGPASAGNGALDYDSSFKMNDGFLLAVGYSGMAQMPSEASINSVMIGLEEYISDGDVFNIQNSEGMNVITFEPAKSCNNIVLCTSLLETGKEYTISIGGSADGEKVDGVYNGKYTGGTIYETFTIKDTMSTVGNATGGMGGFGPGGMPGGQIPGGKPDGGRR